MKKYNVKSNNQKKRNTQKFKKQLKNKKMKNEINVNGEKNQTPKSTICNEMSNLLKTYSKNRFSDGYTIVNSLCNEGSLKTIIGFIEDRVPKSLKFNLNDYKDETMGITYEIESLNKEDKIITTSISLDLNSTKDFMKNELNKEEVNPRYTGWINDLNVQMGEYLIDIFDDFTVETKDLTRFEKGIISLGYLEPKNKKGYRIFPVNFQN